MTMKLALLLTWEILELLLLPVNKITSLGTQIQKLFSLSSLSPIKFILFIGQMGCLDVAYSGSNNDAICWPLLDKIVLFAISADHSI